MYFKGSLVLPLRSHPIKAITDHTSRFLELCPAKFARNQDRFKIIGVRKGGLGVNPPLEE